MTQTQIAAREQVKQVTLADLGRSLTTVADWFLALWAGDSDAARRSLWQMPVEPHLKAMLCLALRTAVRRHQRQLDYELDGFRIRRSH